MPRCPIHDVNSPDRCPLCRRGVLGLLSGFPIGPAPSAPHVLPCNTRLHPYWRIFNAGMRRIFISDSEAFKVWTQMLMGVQLQRERNASGHRYDPNEHFLGVAKRMEDYLRPEPFRNMALWSGGYELSLYARRRGCDTLETTKFGGIVDQCKLYADWKAVSPLWNALSRTYVRWCVGQPSLKKEVHVYIRCDEPTSVLQREEIPAIADIMWVLAGDPMPIKLRWHVVWGDGPAYTLQEVSRDQTLVDSYVFKRAEEAMKVLHAMQARRGNRRS